MDVGLYYLSTIAVFAVLAVLVMGLWNLSRHRSANLSQKLMRWRVSLQLLAIVLIIVYLLVLKR